MNCLVIVEELIILYRLHELRKLLWKNNIFHKFGIKLKERLAKKICDLVGFLFKVYVGANVDKVLAVLTERLRKEKEDCL